ncbi:hypothetical protein [Pelosinus fermentans]|uniref:Aspartate/glutamate/uridylate kinase domain-containing protein n=1 Tax=Pelosinus fermentans JBW45 TaxID=1192197 RepID=I8TYW5_9FIRM|nr:hypothetical protein [Pelosinus fermentans]AJQ26609.1 hypothetical protein JBW_01257 [Pelosinus fermentans JBW45]
MKNRKELITSTKRVIIKLYLSVIIDNTGNLKWNYFKHIMRSVFAISNQGFDIIIVFQGAVYIGMKRLGLKKIPSSIHEYKAVSAVGYGLFIYLLDEMFTAKGLIVAPITLPLEVLQRNSGYINICQTLLILLKSNIIPIIFSDDAIIENIEYQNSMIFNIIANLLDANLLVIPTEDSIHEESIRNYKGE